MEPAQGRSQPDKHGLSFDEAKELFGGGKRFLEIYDDEHSDEEDRFIAIGPIRACVVVVVYTEPQDDVIRIVSARKATRKEARLLHSYPRGIDG